MKFTGCDSGWSVVGRFHAGKTSDALVRCCEDCQFGRSNKALFIKCVYLFLERFVQIKMVQNCAGWGEEVPSLAHSRGDFLFTLPFFPFQRVGNEEKRQKIHAEKHSIQKDTLQDE